MKENKIHLEPDCMCYRAATSPYHTDFPADKNLFLSKWQKSGVTLLKELVSQTKGLKWKIK